MPRRPPGLAKLNIIPQGKESNSDILKFNREKKRRSSKR
jgi:hypothetical protein